MHLLCIYWVTAMSEPKRTANLLGAAALAISDRLLDTVTETVQCGASGPAALVTLIDQPGIGVTELGARIGLSQPAAARVAAGLVSQGLVERRPGHNGRSVALHPTAGGRDTARQVLEVRERVISELVAGLDADEQTALTRALERLLERVYEDVRSQYLICRLCDRATCIAEGAICPVGCASRRDQG